MSPTLHPGHAIPGTATPPSRWLCPSDAVPAGETTTTVSPFVPGGVSDGQWHRVQLHYYNKVGEQGVWGAQQVGSVWGQTEEGEVEGKGRGLERWGGAGRGFGGPKGPLRDVPIHWHPEGWGWEMEEEERREWGGQGCWRDEESREEIWGTPRHLQKMPPSMRTPRDPHPLPHPLDPRETPPTFLTCGDHQGIGMGGWRKRRSKGWGLGGDEGDH